jgi:hypothetical protein
MFDLEQFGEERPLTLSQAAVHIGKSTNGKKPHISTLYRWCTKGCKGVKLDSTAIGGKRYVTVSAIERFIEASNATASSVALNPLPAPTRLTKHVERHSTRRREEIEAARRRLDAMTGVSRPQGPPV